MRITSAELYQKLMEIYYDDDTDGEEITLMDNNAIEVALLFRSETNETITEALLGIQHNISLNSSSSKIPRLASIILNNDILIHKCNSEALERLLYVDHDIAFEKIINDNTLLSKLEQQTLGELAKQHGILVWNRIKQAGLDNLDLDSLDIAVSGRPEIALDILQDNNKIEKVIRLVSSFGRSNFYENVEVAMALINNPVILSRLEPSTLFNIAIRHENCAKTLYEQINTLPQLQRLSGGQINNLRGKYPSFWNQAPTAPPPAEYKRAPDRMREEYRPTVWRDDASALEMALEESFYTGQPVRNAQDFTEKNFVDVNEFLKGELYGTQGLFHAELNEKHSVEERLSFVRYLIAKNDSTQEFKADPGIESQIKELDEYGVILSIPDAIKKITQKENAPPKIIENIQKLYVKNLHVLEQIIIDSEPKKHLIPKINQAILGVTSVNNNSNFKTIQCSNSNSYLGWMSAQSGTRGLTRFSHWHHGDSGEKRARDLLRIANNPDSSIKDIKEALKEAYQQSSHRPHSLSTYLKQTLGPEEIAEISQSDNNSPKPE